MIFKFDEFAKYIHKSFSKDLSLDEVKEILHLEDDGYNKSIPDSPQKRLLLNRIILQGTKFDGVDFTYDKSLFSGVSMWVADNFKGKSTVFKAIRFALTGNEKFTPLIKTWLKRIVLQFTIHDATYTVELNLAGAQFRASIFDCAIEAIAAADPIHLFRGKDSYAKYMQDLFFEEFDYYPIKRVQASQPSINLSDADLTWKTYYTSIYHQSKDYGDLEIGNQHSMVFQMLLGLEYTYSIHALDAKAKKAEREWTINIEQNKVVDPDLESLATLSEKLSMVKGELDKLHQNSNKQATAVIQESLKHLSELLEINRKAQFETDAMLYRLQTTATSIERQKENTREVINQSFKEIQKHKRLITEYQEYIDSGIFFNNLEVTECPHCDHEVDKSKLKIEKESNICMLCDHEMDETAEDTSVWQERIDEAQQEIFRRQTLIGNKEQILKDLEKESTIQSTDISSLEAKKIGLEVNIRESSQNIKLVEEDLAQLIQEGGAKYFEAVEKLLQDKIQIEHKMAIAEKMVVSQADMSIKRRGEVLRNGQALLLRKRSEVGLKILTDLKEIMLVQLHALGLPSYTKVQINPKNFVIYYYQGHVLNNFSDISEGEQLRAKLALYLSLIQLDLGQGLGRHPRLIILDSPTKEEGDQHFVDGLKNTLLHIEKNFGTQVQVIVGTAKRELQTIISDPEKIEYREIGEFVF